MQSMNSRQTSSKVLLVAEGRAATPASSTVPIRRFKIARVRPENRAFVEAPRAERAAA